MSTSATKLDYARIRNAQRKNNKSVHELSDATNTQNNQLAQNNSNQQDITPPNDCIEKQNNNNHNKGTPRQNKSDFLNVFGAHFYSGNLDYVQSLIMTNNKSNASISGRDQSGHKRKGHKRAKSSLPESSQKSKTKQDNDENIEPSKSPLITPNISSSPVMSKTPQELTLKADNRDISDGIVEKELDFKNHMDQKNPHNTPYVKDGKLFDQFFRRGGLERRSMSLEDLRLDKKESKGEESNTERGIEPAVSNKECLEKSGLTNRKDFLGSLNSYIQYFDNSETAYKKNKKATLKKYFLDHEHKGTNSMLKKELEVAKEETRSLRKNNEIAQKKILELVKINKVLVRELEGSKLREEGYQERIREIEEHFEKLKERKDHYKEKVIEMQELLEMERVDNENNLAILKQVLATNIDRGTVYAGNKREKPLKDKEYLRGMLKELMQQQNRNRKDFTLGNPLREKKSSNGEVFYNNRYDLQLDKKHKGNKEAKTYEQYDLSLVSHKEDMHSESGDFTSENNVQSNSSMPYMDTSYQRDLFNEIYVSEVSQKKLSKEEQIKYIQSQLMNLMEGQESSPYLYERNSSQKSLNKHKHKASEPNLHNYAANRERESCYSKSSYGHVQKSEFQLKTKIKSNMENRHPDHEMIAGGYMTNKSD